jgi:hypothetical protein
VSDNFQHVVTPHGPAKVEYIAFAVRKVHFLAICEQQSLAGSDTPDKSDIVLLSPTGDANLSIRESFGVCEAKPPTVHTMTNKKSKAKQIKTC